MRSPPLPPGAVTVSWQRPPRSEVGGVQEHTTEKCGLVLEYRNAHEQLKYLALLVVGCWLLVPAVRAAFVCV